MSEKENILKAEAALATVLASSHLLWDGDKRALEAALRVLRDLAR